MPSDFQSTKPDFAQLKPINISAIKCFHTVCNAIRLFPEQYRHHKQFLIVDQQQVPLRKALNQALEESAAETSDIEGQQSSNSVRSTSTDATEADEDPLGALVWSGCYVFNFDSAPKSPKVGWKAGYGRRWHGDPTGRVDLLLGLIDDAKRAHVHGNHAIFNFLEDSASFGVRAVHNDGMVTVSTDRPLRIQDGLRVLTNARTIITFGDLCYLLQFSISSSQERRHLESKHDYVTNVLGHAAPIRSASTIPSETTTCAGKWTLLKVAGSGAESVVKSAISTNGQLVAVKTLLCRRPQDRSTELISRWKRLEDKLNDSRNATNNQYCIRLVSTIPEGNTFPYNVHVLHSPLARQSLLDVLKQTFEADSQRDKDGGPLQKQKMMSLFAQDTSDSEAKLLLDDRGSRLSLRATISLFTQCARGLSAIHQAGFVHRDVKPANFGVVSFAPLKVVIFDLGQILDVSTNLTNGVPAGQPAGGTLGFVAPEREVLGSSFGQPADIWALGCVGVQIFYPAFRQRIPWQTDFNPWRDLHTLKQTRNDVDSKIAQHIAFTSSLQENHRSQMDSLIHSMLYIRPSQRPAISKVIDILNQMLLAQATEET